ncbi:MAG: hypothetical protein ACPGLY_14065 [Rubripirellula sp.]
MTRRNIDLHVVILPPVTLIAGINERRSLVSPHLASKNTNEWYVEQYPKHTPPGGGYCRGHARPTVSISEIGLWG